MNSPDSVGGALASKWLRALSAEAGLALPERPTAPGDDELGPASAEKGLGMSGPG